MAVLFKIRKNEKGEIDISDSLKELHVKHKDANCSNFPDLFYDGENVVFKGYTAQEWNIHEEEKKVTYVALVFEDERSVLKTMSLSSFERPAIDYSNFPARIVPYPEWAVRWHRDLKVGKTYRVSLQDYQTSNKNFKCKVYLKEV
jgi:hypothetical protein